MNFKPFYIHGKTNYNPKEANAAERQKPRGFTAIVSPGAESRTVKVAVAFCSSKDEFIKKVGRAYAGTTPAMEINVRHLPTWLAEQENKIMFGCWTGSTKYNYVLKYVV